MDAPCIKQRFKEISSKVIFQKTNLSHFSLLFRHGSQLIALRARFVGGRPSAFSPELDGGGEARERTVPALECLRGAADGPPLLLALSSAIGAPEEDKMK